MLKRVIDNTYKKKHQKTHRNYTNKLFKDANSTELIFLTTIENNLII